MRFLTLAILGLAVSIPIACSSFDASQTPDGAADGGADGATNQNDGSAGGDAAPIIDAGAAIVIVAQESARTTSVATDAKYIYWWSTATSSIEKADKDNIGPISVVVNRDGQTVTALAVDASGVYWLEAGPDTDDGGTTDRIMRLGPSDVKPFTVRGVTEPLSLLALDATRVVSTRAGGLRGATKALAPIDEGFSLNRNAVAADGVDVFYTYSESIFRLSSGGGTTQVVNGVPGAHQLTFEGGNLYGVEPTDGGGAIFRLDKTLVNGTSNDVTAVAQIAAGPVFLAIDSLGIVVANAKDETITRVPRTGGAATDVVKGLDGLNAVAADARGVYWTTDSGAVGWARR